MHSAKSIAQSVKLKFAQFLGFLEFLGLIQELKKLNKPNRPNKSSFYAMRLALCALRAKEGENDAICHYRRKCHWH